MTAAGIPFAKSAASRSGSGKTALTRAVATSVKSGLFDLDDLALLEEGPADRAVDRREHLALAQPEARLFEAGGGALDARERRGVVGGGGLDRGRGGRTDPAAVARSASAAVSAVSKPSRYERGASFSSVSAFARSRSARAFSRTRAQLLLLLGGLRGGGARLVDADARALRGAGRPARARARPGAPRGSAARGSRARGARPSSPGRPPSDRATRGARRPRRRPSPPAPARVRREDPASPRCAPARASRPRPASPARPRPAALPACRRSRRRRSARPAGRETRPALLLAMFTFSRPLSFRDAARPTRAHAARPGQQHVDTDVQSRAVQ